MKINEAQSQISFRIWAEKNRNKVVNWLDSRSEFYSKIMEEPTTRRTVIRVNLIMVALTLAAISVEQQPLITIAAMVCAGYLVRRLNKEDNQ